MILLAQILLQYVFVCWIILLSFSIFRFFCFAVLISCAVKMRPDFGMMVGALHLLRKKYCLLLEVIFVFLFCAQL